MRKPLDKFEVTQRFGDRPEFYAQYGMRGHNGLDLRTKFWDTPLGRRYCYAVEDGQITDVVIGSPTYGNYIKLKGAHGWQLYAHLLKPYAFKGQWVKEGAVLGITDSTGNVSGAHLHFGWRPNGFNINNGFFGYEDPVKLFSQLSPWPVAFIGAQKPQIDVFVQKVAEYTSDRLIVQPSVISAQIQVSAGIPDYGQVKAFLDAIQLGNARSAFVLYPANPTSTFEVATLYPEKNLSFATVPMPNYNTTFVHAFLHLVRKYINFNHLGFIEDVERYPTSWSNAGDFNDPGWRFAEQYAEFLPYLNV